MPFHGSPKRKCGFFPQHHGHRVNCRCSHNFVCLALVFCLRLCAGGLKNNNNNKKVGVSINLSKLTFARRCVLSLCSKDVRLPVQMQRAMAAEAESSREAKAKVRKLIIQWVTLSFADWHQTVIWEQSLSKHFSGLITQKMAPKTSWQCRNKVGAIDAAALGPFKK